MAYFYYTVCFYVLGVHLNHTHGSSLKVYSEPVTDRNRSAIDRFRLSYRPRGWSGLLSGGLPMLASRRRGINHGPTCLADRPSSYRVPATIVPTILLAPARAVELKTQKMGPRWACCSGRDGVWLWYLKCDLTETNLTNAENVPSILSNLNTTYGHSKLYKPSQIHVSMLGSTRMNDSWQLYVYART